MGKFSSDLVTAKAAFGVDIRGAGLNAGEPDPNHSSPFRSRGTHRISRVLAIIVSMLLPAAIAVGQVSFAGSQIQLGAETLNAPNSIGIDGAGNLFIADCGNNRVVEMVPSEAGYSAANTVLDGLSEPSGVAADWNGNVYVADTGNGRIVMLPTNGEEFGSAITIGTGLNRPMGLAVDQAGNVYVADTGNNRIVELPRLANGFGSLIVVSTGFNGPAAVAVDMDENLYIVDTGNGQVVKKPFTASGYGAQQALVRYLTAPMGIAVDEYRNVYIAETGNGRVVELPWSSGANRYNGAIDIGSNFASPMAVTADGNGNTFVADGSNSQVWEVTTGSGGFGAVSVNSTSASQVYSFKVTSGTVIGDVSVLTEGVAGKDFADSGGSTCVAQGYGATTTCSVNVRFTPSSSGQRLGAVVLYDGLGNPMATAYFSGIGMQAQTGFIPGTAIVLGSQLSGPSGVAVDGNGNVYIADTGNNRVVELTWTGNGYGPQATISMIGLNSPMGMAVDGAGNLYVASNGNDKVIKLPWTGNGFGLQTKLWVAMYGPSMVAVDGAGSVYVTDTLDNRIPKLQWTGTTFSSAQSLGNYRKSPTGIAVDNSGNVYFTMPYMNTVAKVPFRGGQYQQQISLPFNKLSSPTAVAVDGNSNLYVLDSGNNRVVMLPWTGSQYGAQITVASGFNAPAGMAVDAGGNLYVADTGNNQIVKIDLSAPSAMTFAQTYLGSTSDDSAQFELVENIGNLPFAITSVSYPNNFPEGSGASGTCGGGQSIKPGSGCQLAVNFTPQVPNSQLTETVMVADNIEGDVETQHSMSASGMSLGKLNQAISFDVIPGTCYGVAPLALSASASSGLPISYHIISGPASLTQRGSTLNVNGAGTIVVQAVQAGNSTYEAADPVTRSFIVSPAVLTVTANSVSATYGAVPSAFGYKFSGFVLGQSPTQIVTGKASVSVQASGALGAGNYSLVVSQGTLTAPNYSFVFVNGTLTVTKARLQIRANSTTRVYGGAMPQFTWSVIGLVNGDGSNAVAGIPAFMCQASMVSPVGKYEIIPSSGTLTAANYDFTFVSGSLTIVPAVVTVTAANQNMVYGQSLPSLSYALHGFVLGDWPASAVTGAPTLTTKATARSSVGTYAITPSLGTLSSVNYTFAFMSGSLAVQKAVLTVTPEDAAMTYGQLVPTLTCTYQGFVNGDTRATALRGIPSLSTLAGAKTRPGNATISAATGSLTAVNYGFVFGTGTLTIGKAVLTVTPRATVVSYGGNIPVLGFDLTGFVNGDNATTVSGAPALTATASSTSPVGLYAINTTVGTLSSDLYSFKLVSGSMTVSKTMLMVTAGAVASTYGGPIPALMYTMSGFANGETAAVVSGVPSLTTRATASSPAGVYAVNVDVSKLSSRNYSFSAVNSTIVVNKAVLTVTPTSSSMIYGTSLPAFTYKITGLVNKDGPSKVSGSPILSTNATATASAGVYSITPSQGTLAADNYTFTMASGVLTVNQAVATITADNQSMIYGSAVPAMTYTVSGLVNGDAVATAIQGAPQIAAVGGSTSPVGQYSITPTLGTLTAVNYSFRFKNGSLTIAKAALSVTANSLSMQAGSPLPALTYTVSGLMNGDMAASATSGTPSLTTSAVAASPAASYPINITHGNMTAANYVLNFVAGTLTIAQPSTSSGHKGTIVRRAPSIREIPHREP